MSTKGSSNRYGNSRGGRNGHPTKHINYKFANSFMPTDLEGHYERHGESVNAKDKDDYKNRAIKFANTVDRKNCKSLIDINGTTYKYNTKTKELVIVTKSGIIVSYYKISSSHNKFKYVDKRGTTRWKKV